MIIESNLFRYRLHKVIIQKRKFKEMNKIAEGHGRKLKSNEYPDLTNVMECLFAEEGLEAHPRLTDEVLYRSKGNTLTMRRAKEVILNLAPSSFSISLSSLYNYTQNYKVGTLQAKRHHHGRQVNACISLNKPSRSKTVVSPVINLHWSPANVNYCLEKAATAPNSYVIDSKDPKNIVCADVAPVQQPGKTWKESKGVLLDHEWNQFRTNAVTPSTHLFVNARKESELVGADNIVQVTRSGSAVTLINLSYFEPEQCPQWKASSEALKQTSSQKISCSS